MGFEKQDLLLLVWVHGFKGNEVTFESFPDRLSHLLQATHPTLRIESRVFPAYETRGELSAATLAFVDWLTTLVVNLEVDHGAGGGAGKAKVVLLGHSMGGLLIADAALDIVKNTREGDRMWPLIVGLMAFDTPYLGLHPHTFKHGLTTAASYYETARNVASNLAVLSPLAVGLGFGKFGSKTPPAEAGPSNPGRSSPASSTTQTSNQSRKGKEPASAITASAATPSKAAETSQQPTSWWGAMQNIPLPQASSKTLYGIGAAALGAAAVGTAYYRREDLMNGWRFGYDHMTFVKNLWDEDTMKGRLIAVDQLMRERNVRFWNFYTHLPPAPPTYLVSRTFCILPATTHPTYSRWAPAANTVASDEVHAHMAMFNPRTNDGFYDMGLAVVKALGERIEEEGVRVTGSGPGEGPDGGAEGFAKKAGIDSAPLTGRGKKSAEVVTWKEETDEKGRTVLVEI